jgi:hypothetical protein
VLSGNSAKAKTLLFTIDGSKNYTVSSGAGWLTVTKNATGLASTNGVDIECTANTKGLAPGKYSTTITATGTGSGPNYTAASYCINLTVYGKGILEAEQAVRYKANIASNHPGFTGTGFADYVNNTGDFIEWTLNKTGPGLVSLKFRYANGSLYNRPLKLEINGIVKVNNLAFPPTGGWENWSIASYTTNLNSGSNKIKLTAIGSSGANIDHLAWRDTSISPKSGILEAENAVLYNVAVALNQPGFTGDGFADYINKNNDFIEWTLNKQNPGSVSLNFRYANGSSDNRPLRLEVNGAVLTNLAFPPTGEWEKWSSIMYTVKLKSGPNKIKLTAIGSSGPNIDHLAWKEIFSSLNKPLNDIPVAFRNSAISLSTNLNASVIPNPVSGHAKLFVETSFDIPVDIVIIDVLGIVHTKLFFKNRKPGYLDFSVNELPAGTYFIIAHQGTKKATTRFVVKNK